jgi:hypothetical protein
MYDVTLFTSKSEKQAAKVQAVRVQVSRQREGGRDNRHPRKNRVG